jgi:peptide subunit release factor 1 (eRF1)
VSVYIDDSRDIADAEAQLATIWSDLRKHLADEGAAPDIVASLEQTILHARPAVGHQGRAVIATHEGILIEEHLQSPPPATVLRISEYPYLLPLLELGVSRPTYLIAAVDREGADITVRQGAVARSETVVGGGYPVHKPVSAGWNGYGDLQHTTEEAVRTNVRAVAKRIVEMVDETGAEVVFVCGAVRTRTDVVSALPSRIAARVSELHAGSLGHRVREQEIADSIDAEFQRRRHAEVAIIADRFRTERARGSGLTAEGIAEVCAALRCGDVDTLIVGDLADATVVTGEDRTTVASDADMLSEMGEAPHQVARADEALPFAAISVGATVVRIPGIDMIDGIAALLRYSSTDVVSPEGSARQSVVNQQTD